MVKGPTAATGDQALDLLRGQDGYMYRYRIVPLD
jgi:hypothetical protein